MGLQLLQRDEQRQRVLSDASTMTGQGSPVRLETALEFGHFRLLLRRRQLLADRVPVELGTRAFDLLVVLVDAGGLLVTKDELISRVWPGLVVEESNLKVQISTLRKALGKGCDFIRTEVGRGYRFTAAVRSTSAAPDPASPSQLALAPLEPNAASPTDLPTMISQLARLEAELTKALQLLITQCGSNLFAPTR